MKFIFRGKIYESETKSKTGVLNDEYSKQLQSEARLILDSIVFAHANGIEIVKQPSFKVSDLLNRLGKQIPDPIKNLTIKYSNDNNFYFKINKKSKENPIIEIPSKLRNGRKLYGDDYTGIVHELNHMHQDEHGIIARDGYGIDPSNQANNIAGYNFGYANNELEINSRLHEVLSYIKLNKVYAREISDYDFGPFMEEIFSRFLKIPENEFHSYYNDVLTDDARQHISTTLYALWNKLKKGTLG